MPPSLELLLYCVTVARKVTRAKTPGRVKHVKIISKLITWRQVNLNEQKDILFSWIGIVQDVVLYKLLPGTVPVKIPSAFIAQMSSKLVLKFRWN